MTTSKNNNNNNNKNNLNTIDSILSHYAKSLKPGESISIPLYKGKGTTISVDPLMKSRSTQQQQQQQQQQQKDQQTNAINSSSSGMSRIMEEKFPKMAKFIETVEKPDFENVFDGGRFYQEDVPKVHDDSDDEEEDDNNNNNNNNNETTITNPRKKKRTKRKRPPRQHWVLQTNDEFIQKLKIKTLKVKDPEKGALFETEARNQLSNRYEGLPEANSSHYVLLSSSSLSGNATKNGDTPSISVMPMHGYVSFTQPVKFKTLSMQDAEHAIASKNVSRYMMHGVLNSNKDNNVEGSGINSKPPKDARQRLLGNILHNKVDKDDEDDVMLDVAFREQKVGVSLQTRQDLLSEFGDEDIKVDHDGTLGGANDSEFASGRRFGQIRNNSKKNQSDDGMNKATKDNDGAIADDFYQKDVGAQFDNVDCDCEALFDNNDEYMGAGEQEDYDAGAFADVEDDDTDGDDEDDLELGSIAARSFATKTGMQAIFAKATGDNEDIQNKSPILGSDLKSQRKSGNLSSGSDRSDDEIETSSRKRKSPDTVSPMQASSEPLRTSEQMVRAASPAIRQVDENGLRIISKDTVRREIWLHNGSIPTTQLFKTFKAHGKKYKERAKLLSEILLELCTMDGEILTLKQHYAKM